MPEPRPVLLVPLRSQGEVRRLLSVGVAGRQLDVRAFADGVQTARAVVSPHGMRALWIGGQP